MKTERVERRLAAVLAADVAGYSRLMGENEVRTLEALKAHRREVVDPAIANHNGRVVKTTGDGVLVEFASAVDAVTCAVVVQNKMADRNGSVDPKIVFRIGINVGDIIIEDDDIFGDGVNVAARVENECEPGGVCLSASAYEQVRSKTDFVYDDLGERLLKNIERPTHLYSVRLMGSTPQTNLPRANTAKPLPLPEKPSIAVLPFQNMSGDPEQEYFADGMVEDIITALSRFKSLFVIARNSSFTYKGKPVDIKQVGKELGVRYVLEGSVRRSANRVRITGQLIEAATGAHIWADKFDGSLDDIFELQDNVTASVSGTIAPKILHVEAMNSVRKPAGNWASYDHYLRGVDLQNKRSRDAAVEAIAQFKRAIELDPLFGLPYAYAALNMNYLRYLYQQPFTREDCQEALSLASRAIALSPDDGLVLTYSGQVFGDMEGDFERGASLADQAISLNPNLPNAWNTKAFMYLRLGEPEIAMTAFDRAIRLNPLDPYLVPTIWRGKANASALLGNYDQGIAWAEMLLAQNPMDLPGGWALYANHSLAGKKEKAAEAANRLLAAYPNLRSTALKELLRLRKSEHIALVHGLIAQLGLPE